MTDVYESRRTPSGVPYSTRVSEAGVDRCLLSSGSGVRIPPGAPCSTRVWAAYGTSVPLSLQMPASVPRERDAMKGGGCSERGDLVQARVRQPVEVRSG